MPRISYILPNTELHGGNRVPMDQAQELLRRGHEVEIWSPSPPPDWHDSSVEFVQARIFEGELPDCDACIATFWTTVEAACRSNAPGVFHLCQGFEGIHAEYAPLLPDIDRAYRLPASKLVVSPHLTKIIHERYGTAATFVGTGIDLERFRPRHGNTPNDTLRIGVVGPYGIRPKGIKEVLAGLALARRQGLSFEVWRASTLPCSQDELELNLDARFHTRLSTAGMIAFYQSVDCLIHGSWNEEGFGLPPLEASACGCAVAATDIDPMKAFSPDSLIRFPPSTPEAIPEVVHQLQSPETRARLRRNVSRDLPSLDIRRVVDRLEASLVGRAGHE